MAAGGQDVKDDKDCKDVRTAYPRPSISAAILSTT